MVDLRVLTLVGCCIVISTACGARSAQSDRRAEPHADAPRIASANLQLDVSAGLRERYAALFAAIESTADGAAGYSIEVRLDPTLAELPAGRKGSLQRAGAFWLRAGPRGGELIARDEAGVLNGLTTLERQQADGRTIPAGETIDWPVHQQRALHVVLRGIGVADLRVLIDKARRARLNLLILQLADGVRLNTLAEIARPDALSREELVQIVAYARSNGIDVVPEVKLLSHQEKFLKNTHPEWMYNAATYDPRGAPLRDQVFAYLAELIELIDPKAVHIGHDEVRGADSVGHRKGLRRDEQPLPAALYEQSVVALHGFLQARGRETWMWGDMLIGPADLPTMDARNLNALPGYSVVRKSLPRDIVICDWHYYDRQFPSAKLFSDLGYAVMGTTWKRPGVAAAFSRSVADLPHGRGMIATTWFEVQRRRWKVVDDIISHSGEAFWYAR